MSVFVKILSTLSSLTSIRYTVAANLICFWSLKSTWAVACRVSSPIAAATSYSYWYPPARSIPLIGQKKRDDEIPHLVSSVSTVRVGIGSESNEGKLTGNQAVKP